MIAFRGLVVHRKIGGGKNTIDNGFYHPLIETMKGCGNAMATVAAPLIF